MERPLDRLSDSRWKDMHHAFELLRRGRIALDERLGQPARPEKAKPPAWTPARALRALRRGAGRTQERLAFESGVRQAEISAIENGRLSPRWETLERLFAALGAEPLLLARSRGLTACSTEWHDAREPESWRTPRGW